MKRSKQDAADKLVDGLRRVIKEYERTKDAPAQPRTGSLLPAAESAPEDEWPTCHHVPRCSHRTMHEIANQMAAGSQARKP